MTRTSPHKQLPCLTLMGLPSGLERTRGVVEHYRAPFQEEQPQRTPADGGPHGGRPLTSKPRRRRVSHLSQTGYKQGTGLGGGDEEIVKSPYANGCGTDKIGRSDNVCPFSVSSSTVAVSDAASCMMVAASSCLVLVLALLNRQRWGGVTRCVLLRCPPVR